MVPPSFASCAFMFSSAGWAGWLCAWAARLANIRAPARTRHCKGVVGRMSRSSAVWKSPGPGSSREEPKGALLWLGRRGCGLFLPRGTATGLLSSVLCKRSPTSGSGLPTIDIVEADVHAATVAVVGDHQGIGDALQGNAAGVIVLAFGDLQQVGLGRRLATECAEVNDPLAEAVQPTVPVGFAFHVKQAACRLVGDEDAVVTGYGRPLAGPVFRGQRARFRQVQPVCG